jgi:hypothetical protein
MTNGETMHTLQPFKNILSGRGSFWTAPAPSRMKAA